MASAVWMLVRKDAGRFSGSSQGCGVCVFVCVRVRGREGERERERGRERESKSWGESHSGRQSHLTVSTVRSQTT